METTRVVLAICVVLLASLFLVGWSGARRRGVVDVDAIRRADGDPLGEAFGGVDLEELRKVVIKSGGKARRGRVIVDLEGNVSAQPDEESSGRSTGHDRPPQRTPVPAAVFAGKSRNRARSINDHHALMQIIITLLVLGSALYILIIKTDTDASIKNWAFGIIGTLVGFWFKRP